MSEWYPLFELTLVWQFGTVGATVATAVSFLANAGMHARYLSQHIEVRLPDEELRWLLLASVGMSLVLFPMRLYLTIETFAQLFTVIAVGSLSYFAFVFASRPLRIRALRHSRDVLL